MGDSRLAHEGLLDSGLFFIDQGGSTLSLFTASAGYQHTFAAHNPTAVYANLGLGLYREGGGARVSTATSYGAGLGVRHVVADRHGALRAEVRVDRLEPEQSLGRPLLITVGLRLGFDLWL